MLRVEKNSFTQGWILIVHTSNIIETENICVCMCVYMYIYVCMNVCSNNNQWKRGKGFERMQGGAALGWVGGRKGNRRDDVNIFHFHI